MKSGYFKIFDLIIILKIPNGTIVGGHVTIIILVPPGFPSKMLKSSTFRRLEKR